MFSLATMWARERTSRAGSGSRSRSTTNGVQHAVAGWRPYAGLVYFHLLLDRLAARGDLE
jgi:hypothetical protein